MSTQEEITAWEKENAHKISGWTIDYAEKISKGIYKPYEGKKIITFDIVDGSTVSFECITPNPLP